MSEERTNLAASPTPPPQPDIQEIGPVRPNTAVRDELEAYLQTDPSNLGSVYRGNARGLVAGQIASELNVRTSGFVWNSTSLVRALVEGKLPTAPTLVKESAQKYRALLKLRTFSQATHDYLTRNLAVLERRATGETAGFVEVQQAENQTEEELRELAGHEDDPAPSSRAWLVRGASVNGLNLLPTWLAKGSCSVAASRLRPIEPPVSRKEIAATVEDDYSHVSYNAREEKIAEFDAFINRMQPDDIVVTTSGGDFYVGRIAGDCSYVKSHDDRSNLRRAVAWANADSPVDSADLPDALTVKLSSQHTIVDLTNEIGSLKLLLESPSKGSVDLDVKQAEATLPDASDELADQLLVDREWLQEQIELLRDRRQLIFYGPPGTGKTFLANAIAKHLTAREAIKLVQFHPAYSYEDFFEGFRPVSSADGSGVAFKLSPGPFRRLVDAARENPGTAYVLIIDEINRANLAKVFGELYFLLEYRGHAIDLLYSAGDEVGFTLPKNVYLIGTMNTADRSIALVDTAMRRRFAFTALHPSEEPTSGVLGKWLAVEGHSQTCARLLESLNGLIEDEDFKIGPSYFMRDSAQTDTGLRRVWKSSILPLLEEHHYGESIDVAKRYDLARILRSIAPDETADVGGDGDASSDPEREPDEVF